MLLYTHNQKQTSSSFLWDMIMNLYLLFIQDITSTASLPCQDIDDMEYRDMQEDSIQANLDDFQDEISIAEFRSLAAVAKAHGYDTKHLEIEMAHLQAKQNKKHHNEVNYDYAEEDRRLDMHNHTESLFTAYEITMSL